MREAAEELGPKINYYERELAAAEAAERYAQLRPRASQGPNATQVRANAAGVDALGRSELPDDPITVDHIVPVREIVAMPGFRQLDDANALAILDHADNLVPMRRSTNSARGDRPWSEFDGWRDYATGSEQRRSIQRRVAELRAKEDELRSRLPSLIEEALRLQRSDASR